MSGMLDILCNLLSNDNIPSLKRRTKKTTVYIMKYLRMLQERGLVDMQRERKKYKIQLTDKGKKVQVQMLKTNEHINIKRLFENGRNR